MTPLTKKYFLKLPPASDDDKTPDLERVLDGLRREGVDVRNVPVSVIRKLPWALRESNFEITATVDFSGGPELIDVEPGRRLDNNLGLAVDLGTTNIVCRLVDLNNVPEAGLSASDTNPQTAIGEDILARIHHCLKPPEAGRPAGLEELKLAAVNCINALAEKLAGNAGVSANDISCACISGNTTMAHLFLGLDPYNICRAPYVPAANRFGVFKAKELGLDIKPEAQVVVLPNVGSYVGGDVLAGMLASGMTDRDGISILVDVGTNAEIIVGNRDWLVACAGAAGPALEGGVVSSGMRAAPGAIDRIKIDVNYEPSFTVIGNESPVGMCGSALIDLLSELFRTGLIDGRGKFIPGKTGRVVETEWGLAYSVADNIVFTEKDIENLIRTKAAMYTALTVVTAEIGITFNEIESFFVAGTFGEYIAADKAVSIGMLPDIPLNKFKLLGNSSLKGAVLALLDLEAIGKIEKIASMITYKELNASAEFMSLYRAAMFLPHTDASLFPSAYKS
ncbi:MAG: ASKHA domain-containing protein [Nitrospirota bacterium]